MRILITGASGFIGFHLINKLLKNHEVYGIDSYSNNYDISLKKERYQKTVKDNYFFFEQNIRNIKLPNVKFDLAINLAAQPGVRVDKSKEYLYRETNEEGFIKFCNFCIERNIKKIIYASSSSVYSDDGEEKFKENHTLLRPKSLYGKSKLENEKYASYLADKEDISIIGLRFFSVYGPFGRPDMAYYSFARSLMNNEKIILNNYGTMARDMTYIDDIISGVISSFKLITEEKTKFKNEIFNLGNDSPVMVVDLLKEIEKQLSLKAAVIHAHTNNESKYTHADITKAKKILGYKPITSIDIGIKKFLEWCKKYERK